MTWLLAGYGAAITVSLIIEMARNARLQAELRQWKAPYESGCTCESPHRHRPADKPFYKQQETS